VNYWNKYTILSTCEQNTYLIEIASLALLFFQCFGMLQVRGIRFHFANDLVLLRSCAVKRSINCKKCALLAAMLLFHSCCFARNINQGWKNLDNTLLLLWKLILQKLIFWGCTMVWFYELHYREESHSNMLWCIQKWVVPRSFKLWMFSGTCCQKLSVESHWLKFFRMALTKQFRFYSTQVCDKRLANWIAIAE